MVCYAKAGFAKPWGTRNHFRVQRSSQEGHRQNPRHPTPTTAKTAQFGEPRSVASKSG